MTEISFSRGDRVRMVLPASYDWPEWAAACGNMATSAERGTIVRVNGDRALVIWDGGADDAQDVDHDGMLPLYGWLTPVWALETVNDERQ